LSLETRRGRLPLPAGLLLLATLVMALGAACGKGSTSVEPEPDPDPGANPEPGVVQTPPEGAAQVSVQLLEWSVTPDAESAPAGEVYFLADNVGGEVHELVVVKSDLPPGELPVVDGKVQEDSVDFRGEIEGFAAGSQASGVFDLEAGTYILFCNIVEEEGGDLESHYLQGMHTTFTVQ
jgi:hypothetical protein